MEVQIQDRSKNLKNPDVTAKPLKAKEKSKHIGQLWNSLFKVYEKEADKENESLDDISCLELEDWSITSSFYTQSFLSRVDSHIVSKAISGSKNDIIINNLKFSNGEKQTQKTRKKEEANKSKSAKSSLEKFKKAKQLMKNNIKVKSLSKVSSSSVKRSKRKAANTLKEDILYIKTKAHHKKQSTNVLEKNSFKHKCNLKLRYCSQTKTLSTRLDKRVFKCHLIFKVCECSESDEMF